MAFDSGPDDEQPSGFLSRLFQSPLKLIGALVVVLAVAVLAIVVVVSGGSSSDGTRQTDQAGLADKTPLPTPEATIDLNRPTPSAPVTHLPSVSEGDRLMIPRFGVDAPLTYRAVGRDGQMPNPDTPDDVAYYDFSAWPGLGGAPGRGGNAVFSGHVDSGRAACKNGTVAPPCEAVFWELRNLSTGDEIQIRISGETFNYRVVTRENISAVDGAWDQIVASTAEETLTIITCGGEFDRRSGSYNLRTVVTAERA